MIRNDVIIDFNMLLRFKLKRIILNVLHNWFLQTLLIYIIFVELSYILEMFYYITVIINDCVSSKNENFNISCLVSMPVVRRSDSWKNNTWRVKIVDSTSSRRFLNTILHSPFFFSFFFTFSISSQLGKNDLTLYNTGFHL